MKKKVTGDNIKTEIGKWTFGGKVSNTFDNHIKNSRLLAQMSTQVLQKKLYTKFQCQIKK